jgi:hypothetical protein
MARSNAKPSSNSLGRPMDGASSRDGYQFLFDDFRTIDL